MNIAIAIPLLFLLTATTSDAETADEAAVRRAVGHYAEAVYEAKPDLIDGAVRKELSKLGLVRREGSSRDIPMSFERLRRLCEEGYKSEPARRDVEVFGALDRIACARITADWGIDYLLLDREAADAPWMIRHVLWQSHPGLANDVLDEADREAIERAGNDYIDAFYKAEPDRIDRSVAEDLVKFGYYVAPGADRARPVPMDHAALRQLSTYAFAESPPPADAPHEVEILDALDHIALVKIVGAWGNDYVTVAKRDHAWKILHVLWQSSHRQHFHEEVEETTADGESLVIDDAVSPHCPFSGDPIRADSLTSYRGKVVGFCNPGCRDKFAANPKAFVHLVPALAKDGE